MPDEENSQSEEYITISNKLESWKTRYLSLQGTHNKWVTTATVPSLAEASLVSPKLDSLDVAINEYQEEAYQSVSDKAEMESLKKTFENYSSNLFNLQVKVNIIKTNIEAGVAAKKVGTPFKLEKLQLPKFTGKFSEWNNFQDLFESAVVKNHTLTDTEKMVYLKSALAGEAVSIVSSFSTATTSFANAWSLVKARFSNQREIIFAHIRKFDMLNAATESSLGIRKLVDTINECISSLAALRVPVDKWDIIIIYLALKKLDSNSKKEWLLTQDSVTHPVLKDFIAFLEKRATALADSTVAKIQNRSSSHSSSSSNNSSKMKIVKKQSSSASGHTQASSSSSSNSNANFQCTVCKQHHYLHQCPVFISMTVSERKTIVQDNRLCYNCLFQNHLSSKCPMSFTCKICKLKHHSLLHEDRAVKNSEATVVTTHQDQDSSSVSASMLSVGQSTSSAGQVFIALMETALVLIKDINGKYQICRIFLDSGSEDNFISESCISRLGLKRQRTCVSLKGISGVSSKPVTGFTSLSLSSRVGKFSMEFNALILPKITGSDLPVLKCKDSYAHLNHLQLADPTFHSPGPIDILIGNRIRPRFLLDGLIPGRPGQPSAQNSFLGWILSGEAQAVSSNSSISSYVVHTHHSKCSSSLPCLDTMVENYLKIEDPTFHSDSLSVEDAECEELFKSTTFRNEEGRYVVTLPFKKDSSPLGNSRIAAERRFYSQEKSLISKPEVYKSYNQQMQEYIENQIIEEVPANQIPNPNSYYMPHHVVSKLDSSTTKHRIVFDASAKSASGLSLNDVLMTGPKIQTDLISLLIHFRTHRVAFSADIVKFYNQFLVSSDSADFQRLLWRPGPAKSLKDYRMVRVTFGVTAAPYLAIRCLHQLAEDYKLTHPLAHQVLKHQFLVDNLLSGSSSVEEAKEIQNQVIEVCNSAGLLLRKWSSNCAAVLSSISPEDREIQFPQNIATDEFIKTIGVLWNPNSDQFSIKFPVFDKKENLTKRELLSCIAKVFDPLGFISPITLRPKLIFQELWKQKVDWDSNIPVVMLHRFNKYLADLELLRKFVLSRCITSSVSSSSSCFSNPIYEVHGFSDASEYAYSACIYLKTIGYEGNVAVHLIMSKSKVCPVRGETTPRLELCASVLLVKLVQICLDSLNLKISSTHLYTDSTTVLDWLISSKKLDRFVLNRVNRINSSLPEATWKHVAGEENPADLGTREVSTKTFLSSSLWLHGPDWLKSSSSSHVTSVKSNGSSSYFKERILNLISSSSSFLSMKRKVAFWIRFINNLSSKSEKVYGQLTGSEIKKAIYVIVRAIQEEVFADEIRKCQRKQVHLSSFKSLTPFIDSSGLLRVGGRLRQSFFTYDQQHPVLLPKSHHLTTCIVCYYHETYMHAGPQLLLTLIRNKFWIPRGPQLCSRIVRSCVKCHKANPHPLTQVMGQLPKYRVQDSSAFSQVGVDYAGPFYICYVRGRKPKLIKGYVCVFVCLSVKAVHLEYAGDLTSESFLGALKRFTSLRGCPSLVICDGGRNFLGAHNEAMEIQKFLSSSQHQNQVTKYFAEVDEEIKYIFNPPFGPHHGGIFEAAVKSMKTHMHRVLGDRKLSIEEFITLLAEISACLNSRPITPVSSDPNDFNVLTPGHFIIFRPMKAVPQENLLNHNVNTLSRWQHVQQMVQHFFSRWSSQYLQSLQKNSKWFKVQPNLGVGMLVLLNRSDSDIGPQQWKIGRIVGVSPGPDGHVRVVDVIVPVSTIVNGKKLIKLVEYKNRSITRISPLPIDQ